MIDLNNADDRLPALITRLRALESEGELCAHHDKAQDGLMNERIVAKACRARGRWYWSGAGGLMVPVNAR